MQPEQRAVEAEFDHRARTPQREIAADRLADLVFVGGRIANIVGDLIGLAEFFADHPPRLGVGAGGRRAGHRRRGEQRAGLGAVIVREIDLRFAFPGLARDDAGRHADRLGDGQRQRRQPLRRALDARQRLERQHDQRIAGQHRERFAEGLVHRRPAAPRVRRVEAGQIVMHQRGAMQQFERRAGGFGRGRMILAAGGGDAVTQPRPNPRAARETPRSASPRPAAAGIREPPPGRSPRSGPARSGWRHPWQAPVLTQDCQFDLSS